MTRPHYQQIADAEFEAAIARENERARKLREYEAASRRSWPLFLVCVGALATIAAVAWGILG